MSSIPERTAHPIEERELVPSRVGASELELTRVSSSSDDSYYSVGSEPEAALIEGPDRLERGFYVGSTSEIEPYESPARVSEVPARGSESPARASEAPERAVDRSLGPFHRPTATLVEVTDVITNPSWVHTIILGLQHALVSLGGIIAAAEFASLNLGGTSEDQAILIQTMLFTTGLNSLLQTFIGCRLPTVMGPSLSFCLSILSVADRKASQFVSHEKIFAYNMRTLQGSLICSSMVTIALGYSGALGLLTRFITPLTIMPIVSVMGIADAIREFSQIIECWVYGVPTFLAIVSCQYLKMLHPLCRSILNKYTPIICLVIFWLLASIMILAGVHGILDGGTCPVDQYKILPSARWVYFPYPLQWGTPIFRGSHLVGMLGAALASSIEFTGSLFSVSRLAGATLPPREVISRATGLQGIGQLLNGLWGTPFGSTTSVSNTGVLAVTRIGSRRVIQVSSVWMILFSFGKFGAFFATIPFPIFAASRLIFNGLAVSTSLIFLQFVNINSLRNVWVLAVSLSFGIGVPAYCLIQNKKGLIQTHIEWFNIILSTILASPPMIACVVGIFLDNTIQADDLDARGVPWWVPFQSLSKDPRSMIFYALPDTLRGWIASLRIKASNLRYRCRQRFGSY